MTTPNDDSAVVNALEQGEFDGLFKSEAETDGATPQEPTGDAPPAPEAAPVEPSEDPLEKGLGFDIDDLNKSLEDMLAFVQSDENPAARREELADKLSKGEASDEEQAELSDLLRKSDDDEPALEEELVKGFREDTDIQEAVEISPFLASITAQVETSMSQLAKSMTETADTQSQFNLSLAKSFVKIGQFVAAQNERLVQRDELVKSLMDRVKAMEQTPSGRQSVTTPKEAVMAKSFAGQEAQPQGPTHTEILNGFDTLLSKSIDYPGDMSVDVSRYESTRELTPALQKALTDHAGVRF